MHAAREGPLWRHYLEFHTNPSTSSSSTSSKPVMVAGRLAVSNHSLSHAQRDAGRGRSHYTTPRRRSGTPMPRRTARCCTHCTTPLTRGGARPSAAWCQRHTVRDGGGDPTDCRHRPARPAAQPAASRPASPTGGPGGPGGGPGGPSVQRPSLARGGCRQRDASSRSRRTHRHKGK